MIDQETTNLIPYGDSCIDDKGSLCPFYQMLCIKDGDSDRGVKSHIEIPFCVISQRGDAGALLESEQNRVKKLYGIEELVEAEFLSSQGLACHIKECDKNIPNDDE